MSTTNDWEYKSISIDFDVYKALTNQLKSPSDTYNNVIRRLLALPIQERVNTQPQTTITNQSSWVYGGVIFPLGTEFQANYKGQKIKAIVREGGLLYEGKIYDSPSAAACAITETSVNGWRFWNCRLPGKTEWISIDSLRKRNRYSY